MGTYRLDQQQDACEHWVRGDLPPGFHDLPTVHIPTLILTGELDPTIRPRVGEQLAQSLPNSLHYTVPNSAHGFPVVFWDCLDDIEARFVSQASFAGLDFSCADSNRRPEWISWRDYETRPPHLPPALRKYQQDILRDRF
jgi:hypothetical protein